MSTPAARRPASRYGATGAPKKPTGITGKVIAIIGVILLVALILAVGRYMMNRSEQAVTIAMASYERIDDSTMRLWVDVTREDTSVPAYCIVTSIDYAMSEVGRRELFIAPGGDGVQRLQVDIPSRNLPVSGNVYGCSTAIPSHLTISR